MKKIFTFNIFKMGSLVSIILSIISLFIIAYEMVNASELNLVMFICLVVVSFALYIFVIAYKLFSAIVDLYKYQEQFK